MLGWNLVSWRQGPMSVDWFAGRLRELREEAEMSRQQLADAAGMKVGGIRDLEQGLRRPSWETVLAISQALGVDCTAFTQPPAEREPQGPGRPRKAEAAGSPRAKPRAGRRKADKEH
jgi:transcriptional regulator with XRE-family HTH domain